ncbi:MAG: AAA family ATPase [Candidatus Cloacimonadota bacterium]|nr:MAG: AAA family ATPase [Candidatus Cloacimonadota bacterium]PIE78538.1 MAG: AAA family ATPase [Candidatus Delongbacteria bacterium]
MKKLGLGIQELSEFPKNNLIYVDKTEIIDSLIKSNKYCFLSRPRRFGKSLLVNTIEGIFLGNKQLFKETWIYDKWNFEEKYPVIKISLSGIGLDTYTLKEALEIIINDIAKNYKITLKKSGYSLKFRELIIALSQKNPVVILIDEYDKPIIDYLGKDSNRMANINREILKDFYSIIKDSDKYIKFLFITGVSKFSKVSFFSELNNLTDITLSEKYSQITGYTEKEIVENYSDYLIKIEKKFNIDRDKLLGFIKLWYNGYSWDGKSFMYNPYSVLNLFESLSFNNYWFNSGTPTFLIKMIREKNIDIDKFERSFEIKRGVFDSYDLDNIDTTLLLFQAGYLTIKDKKVDPNDLSESYKLAYPNKEVKDSFYDYLIGEFTGFDKTDLFELTKGLQKELEINDIKSFILNLKTIYANIPSTIFSKENERYYHTVIYLILKLLKADIIDIEKQTNHGRVDAVLFTKNYIFVMEFKMSSSNSALRQIKEKKYYEPYLSDKRDILCVGVAFDKEERNIKEYKTKTISQLLDM